jgi:hypothetical protein
MGLLKGYDGVARTLLNPLEGSIGDVDLDEITANTVSATGNITAGNLSTSGNITTNSVVTVNPTTSTSTFAVFSRSDVGVSYVFSGGTGYFNNVQLSSREASIYNARISAEFTDMTYTANGNPATNVTVDAIQTMAGGSVTGNLSASTYKFFVSNGGNVSPSLSTSLVVTYTTPRLPSSSTNVSALFAQAPTYTAANLIMTLGSAGQLACVSDSPTSGGQLAYWDTINLLWKYVSNNNPV